MRINAHIQDGIMIYTERERERSCE